jgi:EAL domain-containing protein (putative c-di-GMP-specific phosphodiesterase class I)
MKIQPQAGIMETDLRERHRKSFMSKLGDGAACVGCARCETLPEVLHGTMSLYLWLPLGHSAGKIRHILKRSGLEHEAQDDHCVRVRVEAAQRQQFVAEISAALTENERADTHVLCMEDDTLPNLSDVPRTMPLRRFLGLSQGDWLLAMLEAERLTTHFQPIVCADDTATVFAQEALLRGVDEDGSIIPPGRVFDAAREAGLLFQLDLAARRSAIRAAGHAGIDSHIFINFNPTSIYDPAFCLRSTVQAVHHTGLDPRRIVFEIVESDRNHDIDHLRHITDFYRAAGFRIALDDMGSGYSSLNLLHQLRPDFVKLDMELIRGVHQDEYKAMIARKLLEIAQELDIQTVAEGVECVEELAWVRQHGATYVQGYLVARPSAVPMTETPSLGLTALRMAA